MTGEGTFGNLHEVLRSLYDEMMPLCSDITGVATGVAALGALFYVASRVWQALSCAEPIDVYPLFRPFCIGACIMFFPTFVLGTINGILSPIVTGCHGILQGQTLDMEEYAEKREKLEYEALVRNPETAYLVSDEEYERQIEDLGWTPSELKTMAGMAIERGKYEIKQTISNAFRQRAGSHTDADDREGHRGIDRPELCAGHEQLGLHHLHAHRHRGVFHHPDGIDMGDTGGRRGQLRQAGEQLRRQDRQGGGSGYRCRSRACRGQAAGQVSSNGVRDTLRRRLSLPHTPSEQKSINNKNKRKWNSSH